MAPLWLFPAVLSLAAAALVQDDQPVGKPGAISCGAPPVRQVVCYWDDAAPLTSLDACMCSQVIFTRGSEYAPDNTTLQLLPEVRAATEILRRRNPDLRTLVRVPVSSSDAKSPARRQRLANNIQSMVRKGALNGAELVLEEQKEETKVIVPRAALTATLQVIRVQLDTLATSVPNRALKSSVTKSRRRRSYDVTERQVDDEPPAIWHPPLRRPPLRRTRPLTDAADVASTTSTAAAATTAATHGKTTVSLNNGADTTEPTAQDEMATESTESLASYAISKKISSSTTSSTSTGTTGNTGTSAGTSSTTTGTSTTSDPSTTGTSTSGVSTTSGASSTAKKESTDKTTTEQNDDITVITDDSDETDPETEGTAATAPMSATPSTTKVTPSSTSTATPSTHSVSSSETQPSRRTTRAFADDYQDDYGDDDQYWNAEDEESDEQQAQLDDDEVITASAMPSVLLLLRLPAKPVKIAKHYDLKSLSKTVDWFTLPTHNLTDSSEAGQAFHPSRLMGLSDTLNTDTLVDLVTSMGAPTEKIIVSVPSFALKFTLADASNNTPRSAVIAPPAKLDRDELCSMLAIGNWTLERDEDLTAPYAFRQDSWIAFEDDTSIGIKAKYIVLRSLGGVALETADGDAWRGGSSAETSHDTCSNNGGRLLPALYQGLSQVSRRRRGAVLADLQNEISQASTTSIYADGVHSSPFRIVRLVDRQGDVHAIRENTQVEFECSRQGYFSHPRGCNRFYRCVKFNQLVDDYTVFEFDCPPGLAFDEKVEVCVWPGSLRDGGACTGSSEIAPVPRSRFVCPSVEGFYADPENCRWFFACMDHARDGLTPLTAYEFRCPFGLVFDAETMLCDWPWRVVSCGGGRAGLITFNSAGISVYNGASSADSAAFLRSAGGAYANDVGGFGHRLNGDSNAFAVNAGLQGKVNLHSLGLTAPGVASYSIGDDASGSNVYSVGANAPSSGAVSASDVGTISGLSLLSPDDDSPAGGSGGFAHSSGTSNGGFSYSTVIKGNDAYQARGNLNSYSSTVNNGIGSGVLYGQTAYAAGPAISSGSFQQAGYSEGRSNSYSLDEASNNDGRYVQSVTPLPVAGVTVGPAVATGISYEVNGDARFVTGGAAVSVHSTPANEYLPVEAVTPTSATVTYSEGQRATSSRLPAVQTVSRGPVAVLEHSSLNGYSQPRDFQSVVGVYNSPISSVNSISTTVSPLTGYTYSSTPAPVTRTEFAYSTPAPAIKTEFTYNSTPAPLTVSTPAVAQYSAPEYLPPKESTIETLQYHAPRISTLQPVLPTVQTYQQVHSVTAKPAVVYQEKYQAHPVQPVKFEYTKPAVSTYQQVQTVTSKPEIVQHVSTIQPVFPTVQVHQAQEYLPPKQSTIETVEYRAPQISTVQPVQTYQQVHSVTAKPAVIYQESYQAQPIPRVNYEYNKPAVSTYQQVQTVTSKPEIVQRVSTVQPVFPTVQIHQAQEYLPPKQSTVQTVEYRAPQVSTVQPVQSYQQVHSVTSKPAVVYQESYQAQPIPRINYEYNKPAVSTYQQVQTVTSKPEVVQHVSTIQPVFPTVQIHQAQEYLPPKQSTVQTVEYRAPQVSTVQPVQSYQQVHSVTSKPAVVYQESYQAQPIPRINYEYNKPAVSTYQQVQTVTSKPEIVQHVSTIQPVFPTVQTQQTQEYLPPKVSVGTVEYRAPQISTVQPVQSYQQVHSVTSKPAVVYQESYQAQPIPRVNYEYSKPAVSTYQQVQPVTVKPTFYQQVYETKAVQPIKYEYTRPTISTYQQVQTVTTKPDIVQPVQPVSVEYRSPAIAISEQVQQAQRVEPVQPAISYEYKSPAVSVHQQVQTVPAQPQVVQEYRAPVVHQQSQYVQGEQYKAALKYQEVEQINNVAQPQPAVYQVNHPQVNFQLANPTPFVHTYQQQKSVAPTIKAQEVVYDYNAPASVPIRQKETHTVELPNLQYQTYQQVNEVAQVAPVTQAPVISVKNHLYAFAKPENQAPQGYVQTVYSTPAPPQYTTVDQGASVQYTSGGSVQYSSSGASQYSGISSTTPVPVTKVVSQPAQVSFVSSTPASVEISNDGGSVAYNTATLKECATCSSSTANLRLSTTAATVPTTAAPSTGFQFSYQSPGIPSQPQLVDVQEYYAQNRTDYRYNAGFANLAGNNLPDDGSALYFLQPQTNRQRPDRLDLTYYSTPRPAVSTVDKTTYTVSPAPEKIYVDEPNPEITYQAEAPRSTLRPIVVAEVTTAQPPVYSETHFAKASPTVIKTELKQEIPFNQEYLQPEFPQTQITYGARTKPKVISEFNYVADGVPTVSTPAPVEIESYHSTSGASIDVYPTAKPALPPRRLRPTAVSQVDYAQRGYDQVQQQYAANYGNTEEQYLAGLVSEGISGGFGTKSGAAGISSTSYVTGSDVQYTGTQGQYDENGYVRNTLRAKPKEGRKKTKIVIVTRLTDVNPLLVGKLGAQCSCARRRLNLKGRRPGLRKVVRIIRPSTSGDVYSSTTPGYVEVSSSSEKSSEFEEDLALINDAEKEDEESRPFSTTAAPVSSTTTASRGSSYRGRGSYYQAGKAKSTIYVSSTEEPEHEDDGDYNGEEELSPAQYDENAVQIPARVTQSRRGLSETSERRSPSVTSERRGLSIKSSTGTSSNAVPSSQTVDLGSQGTVECQRPGLFRHPQLCNKFYSCNWDSWKKKYVVNIFNCPIHLAYDSSLGACNWPSKGPACVNGKLLV